MTANDKQLPGEVVTHVPQMSLRDWFSGMALMGVTCARFDGRTESELLGEME